MKSYAKSWKEMLDLRESQRSDQMIDLGDPEDVGSVQNNVADAEQQEGIMTTEDRYDKTAIGQLDDPFLEFEPGLSVVESDTDDGEFGELFPNLDRNLSERRREDPEIAVDPLIRNVHDEAERSIPPQTQVSDNFTELNSPLHEDVHSASTTLATSKEQESFNTVTEDGDELLITRRESHTEFVSDDGLANDVAEDAEDIVRMLRGPKEIEPGGRIEALGHGETKQPKKRRKPKANKFRFRVISLLLAGAAVAVLIVNPQNFKEWRSKSASSIVDTITTLRDRSRLAPESERVAEDSNPFANGDQSTGIVSKTQASPAAVTPSSIPTEVTTGSEEPNRDSLYPESGKDLQQDWEFADRFVDDARITGINLINPGAQAPQAGLSNNRVSLKWDNPVSGLSTNVSPNWQINQELGLDTEFRSVSFTLPGLEPDALSLTLLFESGNSPSLSRRMDDYVLARADYYQFDPQTVKGNLNLVDTLLLTGVDKKRTGFHLRVLAVPRANGLWLMELRNSDTAIENYVDLERLRFVLQATLH